MSIDVAELGNMIAVDDSYGHTTRGKRAARKTREPHAGFRTGGDGHGSTARTGRGVVRAPGALVRSDGLISAERLKSLAGMANTTGFALSVVQGYETRTGYGAPVRADRDRVIGTRRIRGREVSGVTGTDLMGYVRDNIDLLCKPNNVLVASRDRRTGIVTLTVCVVVHNYALARHMAQVAGCAWFVNVQDGTRVAVRKVA